MSRRIDVELTSDRGDGSWTWRAAGAKQPKGVLAADLLPSGASVGDVVQAEAEFDIEGIEVVGVQARTDTRQEPERVEILGSGKTEPDVITNFVERKGGGKGRDKGRGKGRDGKGRQSGGGRERSGRDDRAGSGSSDPGDRRPSKPKKPRKPKAPRLRPQRTHRDAALEGVPAEQRPIAEQVLKGGVPAVRQAVRDQNAKAAEAGTTEVKPDALVALAEQLQPELRGAEWRDRAEAALAQMDTVDIRDLRSVVTAAESGARGEEGRALADQVRAGLAARIETDHAKWLAELAETLAEDRVVRALNLSSHPVKAGAPLPRDLADRLGAAGSAALDADVGDKRWATVLEAVAHSPVRQTVEPVAVPASPSDTLLEQVRLHSMQVPQIAARFDIEPTAPPKRNRRKGAATKAVAPERVEAPAATAADGAKIPPPPSVEDPPPPSPPAASADPEPSAPAEPEDGP